MHEFDEITLATRVEADEVLTRLRQLIDRYEEASVADLYKMLGVNPEYTDDKWGWDDLDTARVSRSRGGYTLDLPRPEPLS